jgi:hypothetical protein
MKIIIKLFLILIVASIITAIVVLLYFGYNPTVLQVAKFTHSLNKLDKLKSLFSINLYKSIIILLFIGLATSIIILKKTEVIYSILKTITIKTGDSLLHRFKQDWLSNLLYLIIIPLLASIYYAIKMPVSYDEASTYVNFSSRSILSSISYYPAPNNHILHSVLTNLFLALPFSDLISIRIPSVLVSIMCILFLFSFIKEYYNKYIGYIAIAVFSTFYMALYYSYMSRGYELQCFFFILMTYSIFKIIGKPDNKLYWVYFSVSSILGFYTIPSFLYPFIIGNIFLLFIFKSIRKKHLISVFLVGLITSCLYLPIILINGFGALANNRYVTTIDRATVVKNIPSFFYNIFKDATGLSAILILVIICVGVLIILIRYKGKIKYYFPMVLLISPILLILHSVIPFSRTFQYYNCIISLFIGIILFELLKKRITLKYCFIPLLIIQLLLVYNFNRYIYINEKYSIITQSELLKLDSGRHFYVCSGLFDAFLIFDLKTRNINNYSIEYKLPININIDTITNKKYDFYIIDNSIDCTKNRKPILKNEFYTIY